MLIHGMLAIEVTIAGLAFESGFPMVKGIHVLVCGLLGHKLPDASFAFVHLVLYSEWLAKVIRGWRLEEAIIQLTMPLIKLGTVNLRYWLVG